MTTTYTILTATGGVNGTFAGVTETFPFLTPTLTYDANNVFLSLFLAQGAFAAEARTPNQRAVARRWTAPIRRRAATSPG